MTIEQAKLEYVLRLGDNALILGQRLSEWCGHGPILEQDIAITNIALDLVGQARVLMDYAAELEGKGRTEDDLAFLRLESAYRNLLLCEQPNEDWAYTIVRQFLFDNFNFLLHQQLLSSSDERLAALAARAIKEITYHLRYSSEWMIRLGDGTDVSHQKMQTALNDLWTYSGEALIADSIDQQIAAAGIGPNPETLKDDYLNKVKDILEQATLKLPDDNFMQTGGKQGTHTEHLGFILTEMQYMQRTYPNVQW